MKTARQCLAISALLCLCGCLTNEASSADKAALRASWGDCVAQAVARLDDGKSDPASVAYGVAPQCKAQYNQLSQAMIDENMTDAGRNAMRQQMKAGEVEMITSAVLIHRSKQRR